MNEIEDLSLKIDEILNDLDNLDIGTAKKKLEIRMIVYCEPCDQKMWVQSVHVSKINGKLIHVVCGREIKTKWKKQQKLFPFGN